MTKYERYNRSAAGRARYARYEKKNPGRMDAYNWSTPGILRRVRHDVAKAKESA